jgi:hypothetical protein
VPEPPEEQNDALNLHEAVASVAPVAVSCTARGSDFKATLRLLCKGAVKLQCDSESGCEDADKVIKVRPSQIGPAVHPPAR